MASQWAHVGDIGAVFEFTFTEKDGTTPYDLTGATTVEVKLQKRDKTGKTWALTVTDALNGIADFTTTAPTDLDLDGRWICQGHVIKGGSDFHFTQDTFEILPVISGA